jgi:hypothetical protein
MKTNLLFNSIKLLFLTFFTFLLLSCDGDAKIVEMQGYTIQIDTLYKYKVELKDGKSDIIKTNRKLEKNDVVKYGW